MAWVAERVGIGEGGAETAVPGAILLSRACNRSIKWSSFSKAWSMRGSGVGLGLLPHPDSSANASAAADTAAKHARKLDPEVFSNLIIGQ